MQKARVTIYTKPGCHLCEVAKQMMLAANCSGDFTLEEVNIEIDPLLFEKYKNDIPVIMINGAEAFRHRLTPQDFRRRLRSC